MSDNPIRIAQIIGKWVGGGVEAVVMNYYKYIDKTQIQFDFICDDDSTNIPYEEIEKLGGRVILIPPYQKVTEYQKELKKVLKEGNYPIVHSHINTLSIFPLRAAKKVGIPVRIAHSHSTTSKKEWKRNLLKMALKPFAKVYATDYFACTEYAGRWLFGNKEFDNGNVYVLNNAIDLDKFKYNEKIKFNKRDELGINKNALVIGHVGRFMQQKNHHFIIDIFHEIHKKENDSKLLLVGQGPLMDEIKEKVSRLNLNDSVVFLGQRDDVNELYQAMDVFLFPSLYEGLGMVAIEAQTAACYTVVSTEVPTIVKVTENVSFIDLNESAELWANSILANYKLNKQKNYVSEVEKKGYNIEIEVKKLEDKYKSKLRR